MIGLSQSSIGIFKNCPRCFWWSKNRKIDQPEGIKASIPKGFDRIMKEYVDGLVASGQPVPWLADVPNGGAPFHDRVKLKKFMNWQTFQTQVVHKGVALKAWGNVDDVIEHSDGSVSGWDFKTKDGEPGLDYGIKYYQTQLDFYHLLLEGNGLKCTGNGILSYGWPLKIVGSVVEFGWKNLVMDTDPTRALDLMLNAQACLEGPQPAPGVTFYKGKAKPCEFCTFVSARAIK